jgi:HEPN domain-containing protein
MVDEGGGTAEEWAQKAREHAVDARTLQRAGGSPASIYHQSGLAVECALKAVIIKRHGLNQWPSDYKSRGWGTHDLSRLLKHSGRGPDMSKELAQATELAVSWLVIKDWNSSRPKYPGSDINRQAARDMVRAVSHDRYGVLKWLLG